MRWWFPIGIVTCPACIVPSVYPCFPLSAFPRVPARFLSDLNQIQKNQLLPLTRSQDCSPLKTQGISKAVLDHLWSWLYHWFIALFSPVLFQKVTTMLISIVIVLCHFWGNFSKHFYKTIAPYSMWQIHFLFLVPVKITIWKGRTVVGSATLCWNTDKGRSFYIFMSLLQNNTSMLWIAISMAVLQLLQRGWSRWLWVIKSVCVFRVRGWSSTRGWGANGTFAKEAGGYKGNSVQITVYQGGRSETPFPPSGSVSL